MLVCLGLDGSLYGVLSSRFIYIYLNIFVPIVIKIYA